MIKQFIPQLMLKPTEYTLRTIKKYSSNTWYLGAKTEEERYPQNKITLQDGKLLSFLDYTNPRVIEEWKSGEYDCIFLSSTDRKDPTTKRFTFYLKPKNVWVDIRRIYAGELPSLFVAVITDPIVNNQLS